MVRRVFHAKPLGRETKPAPAGPAIAIGRRPGTSPRTATPWALPGFCWNARVTTSFGEMPVQGLRLRDPVRLANGTCLPVAWIDRIHLDGEFLRFHPDAQPVLISAGALGMNRPRGDLLVSPQQRVALGSGYGPQVFRLARDLTNRPGIMRQPQFDLTYFRFHCDAPAVAMVEGVPVPVEPPLPSDAGLS